MPMLVAGLLLLWLSSILLRGFVRGNPAAMSRFIRKGGGSIALVVAILMMVRGEFNVAFLAAGFGFWLLGSQPRWAQSLFGMGGSPRSRASQAAPNGASRVQSDSLDMVLDQASGRITGWFRTGPAMGRSLDDLSRVECVHSYRWCAGADPRGARLLEAYFDRRFPGWREAADFADDPSGTSPGGRAGRAGGMSDDEAYHVLGLPKGAGREEVARAHRGLMKKYHPDYGGTTEMAARVNEAKDVLMRRHP